VAKDDGDRGLAHQVAIQCQDCTTQQRDDFVSKDAPNGVGHFAYTLPKLMITLVILHSVPETRMPVSKLVLLRPLQSAVSLPARSRSILPPDVRKITQRNDKAEANCANIDGMSCRVKWCILSEICESSDKGTAVANYITMCQKTSNH
jgi:hypothetical protein